MFRRNLISTTQFEQGHHLQYWSKVTVKKKLLFCKISICVILTEKKTAHTFCLVIKYTY